MLRRNGGDKIPPPRTLVDSPILRVIYVCSSVLFAAPSQIFAALQSSYDIFPSAVVKTYLYSPIFGQLFKIPPLECPSKPSVAGPVVTPQRKKEPSN